MGPQKGDKGTQKSTGQPVTFDGTGWVLDSQAEPPPGPGGMVRGLGNAIEGTVVGAAKALGQSGVEGGALLRKIPGVDELSSHFPEVNVDLERHGKAEEFGAGAERVGEFLGAGGAATKGATSLAASRVPASMWPMVDALVRSLAGGASAAGVGALHGDDNLDTTAMLGAAGPLAGEAASQFAPLVKTKFVQQVGPYLTALLMSKMSGGLSESGLGAGLGAFGLSRMLARQAMTSPNAVPMTRRALQVGGALSGRTAAAAASANQPKRKPLAAGKP